MIGALGAGTRKILDVDQVLPPARLRLISSSLMIRPWPVSTSSIFPGRSRSLVTMRSAGMSSTPTSDAMMTRSSLVMQYRDGRNPLRSSIAPMSVPSVKAIDAGPSHGSISDEWYS
jgi:hypothetical protein